jgi:hypothetical protein
MLKQLAFSSSKLRYFRTAACFASETAVFIIQRQSVVVQPFMFFLACILTVHVLPNGLSRITEKPFRQCERGFVTTRNRLSGNTKRAFPQSVSRKNALREAVSGISGRLISLYESWFVVF